MDINRPGAHENPDARPMSAPGGNRFNFPGSQHDILSGLILHKNFAKVRPCRNRPGQDFFRNLCLQQHNLLLSLWQ